VAAFNPPPATTAPALPIPLVLSLTPSLPRKTAMARLAAASASRATSIRLRLGPPTLLLPLLVPGVSAETTGALERWMLAAGAAASVTADVPKADGRRVCRPRLDALTSPPSCTRAPQTLQ
jgi:hypothetical protein